MIDVHAALPYIAGGRTRMILTVHDELLFEAPTETRQTNPPPLFRDIMQNSRPAARAPDGRRGIGENWKEAKSLIS